MKLKNSKTKTNFRKLYSKIAILMLLFVGMSAGKLIAQTTLAAGDLAIVYVNSVTTDKFSVVVLKPGGIAAGTVINFTDNGFASASTGRTGEGFVTYTAPAAVAQGGIISYVGTATGGFSALSGSMDLAASGDQLIAFQGPTANWATLSGITVVTGMQFALASGVITTGTATTNNTYAPSATVLPTSGGVTNWFYLNNSNADNVYFTKFGSTTSGTYTLTASSTALRNSMTQAASGQMWVFSTTAVTSPTYAITVAPAANTVTVKIKNITQLSATDMEFDVWASWTGDNETLTRLQSVQCGINFNYAGLANGGTITGSYVSGSTDLSLPSNQQNPTTWEVNATSNQIRLIGPAATVSTGSVFGSSNPNYVSGDGIRIGTFHMTNSNPFTIGATPNFSWSFATGSGTTTQSDLTVFPYARTLAKSVAINVTAIDDIVSQQSNFTVDNNPAIVNMSTGSTAAVMSGTTAICSGSSANLSVTITDGTSPYTVVYTDGTNNFTVNSYVSGDPIAVSPTTNTTYEIVSVTDAGSNAGTGNTGSAVITVNSGVNNTPQTVNSSCSSYTWSVNSQIYTTNGTYTAFTTNANGCQDTNTLILTLGNTSAIALATSGNSASTIGSTTSSSVNQLDGTTETYTNSTCALVASITDAAGGNTLGNTTVSCDVTSSLPQNTNNNRYFARRYYTITPTSNGVSTVLVYLTQADLDNYNSNNGTQADLPSSGNNSDPAKLNLRVMQVTGNGDLTTGTLVPDYATMTWDATNNRWEVLLPTTITNSATFKTAGKYYFFTNESCTGVALTGLVATTPSSTTATLTWTAANTLQGWYTIRYRQVGTSTWTYGTSSVASKTLSGLSSGTTYEVNVRRDCSAVDSSAWDTGNVTFTTPSCATGIPAINPITSVTYTTASLTWNSVLTSGGWHNVRYRVLNTSTWTNSSCGSNASTTIAGLSSSTTYEVQVQAACSGGVPSSWSTSAQFTTLGCASGVPVINTPITATYTSASISWPAVLSGSGWHNIRYRVLNTSTWTNTSCSSGSSANISGLLSSTTYEVQVQAACSAGSPTAWSTSAQFTTLGCASGVPVVNTPVTTTYTTAAISWPAVLSGGGWHNIRYRVLNTSTWTNTTCGSSNGTNLIGLTSNTTYEVQVQAACNSGTPTAWSTSAQFTTLGCATVDPVINTPISTTTSTATLSWPAVLSSGGWHNIRYRVLNTATWSNSSCGPNSNTTIAGLASGTTYEVQVQAQCNGGSATNWSTTAQFTTQSSSVCVSGNITLNPAVATTNTVSLSWNSVLTTVGWHNIRYRLLNAATWTLSSNGTNSNTVIAGLMPASTYEIQVQAQCSAGPAGNWSNIDTFTTGAVARQMDPSLTTATPLATIYPNPTQDELNVDLMMEKESLTTLKVMDMSGRVVKQIQSSTVKGMNNIKISLGDLSSGMYTIQVLENENIVHISRVTKN